VVFLGFSIIAKTAIQKNPAIGININTTLQPHIYYTCPAGKVAKVKGRVTCVSTGAAAEGRFLVGTVIQNRWQSSVGSSRTQAQVLDTFQFADDGFVDRVTAINTFMTFEFTLNAGENFSTDQSSGTNAQFKVFAEVLESPA